MQQNRFFNQTTNYPISLLSVVSERIMFSINIRSSVSTLLCIFNGEAHLVLDEGKDISLLEFLKKSSLGSSIPGTSHLCQQELMMLRNLMILVQMMYILVMVRVLWSEFVSGVHYDINYIIYLTGD